MNFNNVITILFAFATLSFGALLGAVRSKIFAAKGRNSYHYFLYGFSVFIFVASIISFLWFYHDFTNPPWFGLIVLLLSIFCSVAVFWFTKKFLVAKNIFKTDALDPIINDFTDIADRTEIKLLCGDLNFFGNAPIDMDKNSQYTHLRGLDFRKVLILCEEPNDATKKIRYGKILLEFPSYEVRFYHPENADLGVRGRIIYVHGAPKLLMYTKVRSGEYQALETNMANTDGALYTNIWKLAWSLAYKPTAEQINNFKELFQPGR